MCQSLAPYEAAGMDAQQISMRRILSLCVVRCAAHGNLIFLLENTGRNPVQKQDAHHGEYRLRQHIAQIIQQAVNPAQRALSQIVRQLCAP